MESLTQATDDLTTEIAELRDILEDLRDRIVDNFPISGDGFGYEDVIEVEDE